MRKKISLYSMPYEVMLLIEYPGGATYINQCGGHVCAQEEIDGVLAPLELGEAVVDAMDKVFDPFGLAGVQGIEAAVADQIDAILAAQIWTDGIKVDRTRIADCWLGWVYVTLHPSTVDPSWSGFDEGTRGVLTWPTAS